MKEFDNISNEQLGCFIDGNCSDAECDLILDSISLDEDVELLSIAYHASELVEESDADAELRNLPQWNDEVVAAFMPISALTAQFRQSAFLGDESEDEDEEK